MKKPPNTDALGGEVRERTDGLSAFVG